MKKRVGVLMGGPSCERDISVKSGNAVCGALEDQGIEAVPIELVKGPATEGYIEKVKQDILSKNIDIAFIALHGHFGEDGSIQRLLEEIKIPYTGSGITASSLGMDKIRSKEIFKESNIPTPAYKIINKSDLDKESNIKVYFKELGNTIVLKPYSEGSSIGLSLIDDESDFFRALDNAFQYSDKAIVEEYIKGREVTVGILEDRPLPVVEVVSKHRFFDFEAKYQTGLTEYKVPASIDKKDYTSCQALACAAHQALEARNFSRVDMILSQTKGPVVLEVNTIPGLTETSLLPKAAEASGITFSQLILKILESNLW